MKRLDFYIRYAHIRGNTAEISIFETIDLSVDYRFNGVAPADVLQGFSGDNFCADALFPGVAVFGDGMQQEL